MTELITAEPTEGLRKSYGDKAAGEGVADWAGYWCIPRRCGNQQDIQRTQLDSRVARYTLLIRHKAHGCLRCRIKKE
ncbi:hypothetical protein ABBQ32_002075 [Trebouxia sp. C0010 RCD-2024]